MQDPGRRWLAVALVGVFLAYWLPGACGSSSTDSDRVVPAGPLEDGVAVGIVYDTSGSMRDAARTASGGTAPKYVIAGKALLAIVDRLEAWARGAAPGTPRKIQVGLYVFDDESPRVAVRFGPLDADALRAWARGFHAPDGPTPLGDTLRAAGRDVLRSTLARKHLLVVTDGESNRGATPAHVLHDLRRDAQAGGTSIAAHFVAFDVAASVFAPVKAEGATLLGASDEAQLNEGLGYVLERKILLEEPEGPAPPAGGGGK